MTITGAQVRTCHAVEFKPRRDSSLRRPTRSPRKNLRGKQEANGKEKFGLLRSE